MKRLTLATLLLILTSAVSAQAQISWIDLLTFSGTKVSAVQGATKIDIATAKTMYDEGVLFVDVQGFFEWKRSRVPGALLGASITEAELVEVADKNKKIVFYCNCKVGSASCNLSPSASAKAVFWGYTDVYYFTNYGDWKEAGYLTESSDS